MLINLSNHPSSKWREEQLNAAQQQYGEVVDEQFPIIDPSLDAKAIDKLAHHVLTAIQYRYSGWDNEKWITIHIMGEMTFVYAFVRRAHGQGIPCVASTTERVVVDNPDGTKTSTFQFVKFREYGIK